MSPGTEAPLPQGIMSEFSRWIKAPKSLIMWVQGTPSTSGTSPLSLAATQVCDVSLKLGIPCVSFFFKPRYNIPSGSADPVSHKKAACISMLYSLVSQLVHLLPHDFRADHDGDFGEDQFQLLDGSFQSANTALKMLGALLDHATPSLVCVVDGIQFGEGPTTTAYFESFLEILLLHQGQRICKICFTTGALLCQDRSMYGNVSMLRGWHKTGQEIYYEAVQVCLSSVAHSAQMSGAR